MANCESALNVPASSLQETKATVAELCHQIEEIDQQIADLRKQKSTLEDQLRVARSRLTGFYAPAMATFSFSFQTSHPLREIQSALGRGLEYARENIPVGATWEDVWIDTATGVRYVSQLRLAHYQILETVDFGERPCAIIQNVYTCPFRMPYYLNTLSDPHNFRRPLYEAALPAHSLFYQSSIPHQWLNSSKMRGHWWKSQHAADVDGPEDIPPDIAGVKDGYLCGLSDDVRELAMPIMINVWQKCPDIDVEGRTGLILSGREKVYQVPSTFFLPAVEELGVSKAIGLRMADKRLKAAGYTEMPNTDGCICGEVVTRRYDVERLWQCFRTESEYENKRRRFCYCDANAAMKNNLADCWLRSSGTYCYRREIDCAPLIIAPTPDPGSYPSDDVFVYDVMPYEEHYVAPAFAVSAK